jgi:D-amino-acid dehydrogenase
LIVEYSTINIQYSMLKFVCMSKDVLIIGGGIIGLSSAFYLKQEGFDVTVIDQGNLSDGCSYGNAGYVCPSHFVPMAAPGIVKQGLKWMFNSKSPFYVQPRLNSDLINWGWNFVRKANRKHVERSVVPMRDISLLSKKLYEEWTTLPGFDFAWEPKGLLDLFKTAANAHHGEKAVQEACDLGLDARMLNSQEVAAMFPGVKLDILGAVYYGCDTQLYPNKLMGDLKNYLQQNGVHFELNRAVTGFTSSGNTITAVHAGDAVFNPGHVVLAAGVWSGAIAKHLHIKMPMVGGRGYSVTLENAPYKFTYPVLLSEARVAISPMNGNKLRFGGTMEITGTQTPPRFNRVQGILESVTRYFPEYKVPMPPEKSIWYGYRPCSADGLPYIGNISRYKNLTVGTGHSMLGLSLGAGTGKLVSELVAGKKTTMDLAPFRVERF